MKIVFVVIAAICLLAPRLFFICTTPAKPGQQDSSATSSTTDSCQTFYDQFTNSAAKTLVEKTQQQASSEYGGRNEQRNQLMGLTISVLLGIIGLTLGRERNSKSEKDRSDRLTLWVVAIAFCFFMHGIDTMLADLNDRQVAYSNNLNRYLLKWDSLENEDIKVVLKKVCEGNEPVDGFNGQKGCVRKAGIFFCDGLSFMFLWWWGLTAAVAGLLVREMWGSKLKMWWGKP